MTFFEQMPLAPPDPVLSLNVLFKNDPRKEKVNLGVGAYKTENLEPWPLPSVLQAEEIVLKKYPDKEYLPIEGDATFNTCIAALIFGKAYDKKRCFVAQTIGGTGALRLAADFVKRFGPKKIYISEPTWPNHRQIFTLAGLDVHTFKNGDFSGIEPRSIVVLQPCCHNPTGIDPSENEWKGLLEELRNKRVLPLFDFAYQGFARGIDEDAFAIREATKLFDELFVTYSTSKNFGLYGERAGAFVLLAAHEEIRDKAASQIKILIRANYSNPPCHGARLVKTVLGEERLRRMWQDEVRLMRERLLQMRRLFVEKLKEKRAPKDFSFLLEQKGMFSFTGLTKEQVEILKDKYGIYMLSNGRISIAGLSKNNLDLVVDAILDVATLI